MPLSEPHVTRKTLADYREDERNANMGTPRGLGVIEDSLNYSGVGRSLVADKNGVLIAGNKTSLAAASAGIEDVIEIETDGDALIVHKRRDLDLAHDARAKALAIADNRASEVSLQWDDVQLAEILTEIKNEDETLLKAAGFYEDELDALLSTLAPAEPLADTEPQIDKADELRQKWQTERGQLWVIPSKAGKGEHRLLCGDSTNAEDVARVMGGEKADMALTDPPYGVKMDKGFEGFGGFGKPIARKQYKDEWDAERPPKEAFDLILRYSGQSVIFGGNFFADLLPQSAHWIVWDKLNTMPTFGDCELAWTNIPRKSVKKITFQYNGLLGKEKERFHPTQKPVGLWIEILKDYTTDNQTVYDPFIGSGTTLVACEQTARLGRGIEIDPRYVAVSLQRLADMGLEPRLST